MAERHVRRSATFQALTMIRRESGSVLQSHGLGDLVDVAAVGRRPAAPLHAVHGPRSPSSTAHSSQIVTPWSFEPPATFDRRAGTSSSS